MLPVVNEEGNSVTVETRELCGPKLGNWFEPIS